jgi:hypothetical protein
MESNKLPTAAFGSEAQKLKLESFTFSCYLLENGRRVLLKNSVQKAFGYDGKSENWLFEFLMHVNRLTPVEPVILEALSKDIAFQVKSGDGFTKRLGISPNLFVEACRTIVAANEAGFLYMSEIPFAKAAENILKSIGNTDIEKLIDYATGYELYKQNHKDALSRSLTADGNPHANWIKSFPDSFFQTIFAFKGWSWKDLNENPEKTGAYINDIIFSRVDDDLFEALEATKPKMQYRKKNTPEQYLENQNLKAYMQTVIAFLRAADRNETIFEQLLTKSFPIRRNVTIAGQKKDANISGVKFSAFSESMSKALQRKK